MGGMAFPISATDIAYQSIVDSADSVPISLSPEELDRNVAPAWKFSSFYAQDFLNSFLPFEEAILEVMNDVERPWDDFHHRSYFYQTCERLKQDCLALDLLVLFTQC